MALLVVAGATMQAGWLVIWTLSYRLTHGSDFTYAYLVGHDWIWDRLSDLLVLGNMLVPGLEPPQALAILVNSLMAGFVLVGLGYLGALTVLDRGLVGGRPALGLLLGFAALFQVTLFVMPGLYTSDIFSYMMYGQIATTYGFNPYIFPPAAFRGNPLLGWIHPIWHQTPSIYGPLWTDLSVPFTALTDRLTLVDQVLAYKVLMNGVHLASLGLVAWLLRHGFMPRPEDAARRLTAFALFAWNPLVLFEVVGNGHNDALMVLLLLLGLVPLTLTLSRRRAPAGAWRSSRGASARWALSLLSVGLSALVKYTTAVVGVFALVVWVRLLPTWRARAAWIGGTGLLVAGITLALFWPWLRQPGLLDALLEAARGNSWQYTNSLPDLLALTVADRWLDPAGRDPAAAQAVARAWAKAITRAIFVGYAVWEAWRLWRLAGAEAERGGGQSALPLSLVLVEAVVVASVRAFLVLLLLVLMWVLTWYFTWPLALATLLGWRRTLTRVVVGYTLTAPPIFYYHHYWSRDMPGSMLFLYAVPPLLIPLGLWARDRWLRPDFGTSLAGLGRPRSEPDRREGWDRPEIPPLPRLGRP